MRLILGMIWAVILVTADWAVFEFAPREAGWPGLCIGAIIGVALLTPRPR